MLKKIFTFLTRTRFGLLLLVNLFFVAGLLGASGLFVGGLIWFGGNVFFMFLSYAGDKVASTPATGSGTVIQQNTPMKDEEEQQ